MNNSEIIRKTQQEALAKFKAKKQKKAKTNKQLEQSGLDKAISMEAYQIAAVMYDKQQHYNKNKQWYIENSKFKRKLY